MENELETMKRTRHVADDETVPAGGFLTFLSRRVAASGSPSGSARGIRLLSKNETEKLAQRFADPTRAEQLRRAQAYAKGFVQRRRFRDLVKKSAQRVKVVDEVLKTEQVFHKSLTA